MNKAIIIFSGIFMSLIFIELFLQHFIPQPIYTAVYNDKMSCYKSDPIYFVTLKKNSNCYYARSTPEYSTETKTNNLGFREENPTTTKKGSGTKRIVFIGDSFTFGQGVKATDTFPKIIEKILNSSRTVETINAGIIGVGPDWYYLFLKQRIIPLQPDIVVVNLYLGNDLSDLDYFSWKNLDKDGLPGKIDTEYEYIDQDGSRRYANTPTRYRIPFFRESHLMIFLTKTIFGDGTKNPNNITYSGSTCYLNPICEDFADQEKKLNKLIVGMKNLAIRHNIRLIITLIPWELQLKRDLLQHSRVSIFATKEKRYLLSNRIEKMLQKNGLTTINLLPVFDAYSGDKKVIYPIDQHWTKEGHRIAAEAISRKIHDSLFMTDKENDSTHAAKKKEEETE